MRRGIPPLLLLMILALPGRSWAEPLLLDLFGRDVEAAGITLADWEGYMANPAVRFRIAPPADAALPVQVRVTAAEPRLHFDLPSRAGASGSEKRLQISGREPAIVAVAIFPARVKKTLTTALTIELTDARGRRTTRRLPVRVAVSANALRPAPETHPIKVDFSRDRTGFFNDVTRRATVQQAVQDWAFYFAPIPTDPVPAQAERTRIFRPAGFAQSDIITNAQAYTGHLLYAYGITTPELRSGGEPSAEGAWQTSGGRPLPLRRSGGIEMETRGNYNRLGWLPPLRDDEWWRATNAGNEPNDLYSIARHEAGHALIFNPANRNFPRDGPLASPAITAYLGRTPTTSQTDHLDGTVDPASLRGAFGNEYHGQMPPGRWLITKLDLLCAEAVGYRLRAVDALLPPAILPFTVPAAAQGQSYVLALRAEGGIPFYDWGVASGRLPPGLALDRFTGEIRGRAEQAGVFTFTVRLRDYTPESPGVTKELTIQIR